ncbi:MAG: hypothetical protein IT379_10130 [Deltaproteobacteria bacterium]|nr:hypothetical protein [Deltaproteobacteria bacterium]
MNTSKLTPSKCPAPRLVLAAVAVFGLVTACGDGAPSEARPEPTSTAGAEPRPATGSAAPQPTLAPPTTAQGILQRLARAMPLDTSAWDAETQRLVEPGGVAPLVGTARAAIVASLGEPNAADFVRDGQAGWTIGRIETARMGHPPILVVTFDATGTVTAARFQLSM